MSRGRRVIDYLENAPNPFSALREVLNPALQDLEDLIQRPRGMTTFRVDLSDVADGDVVARFGPGFSARIQSIDFCVTDEVTTAGKAATLQLRIGGVELAGARVTLTSANCGTKGALVRGGTVVGSDRFLNTDEVTVVASDVTAFAEGFGELIVTWR